MQMEMFKNEAVYEILKTSRKIEPTALAAGWEVSDVLAKATEELGEFSEAVQIRRGKMPHKEPGMPDDAIEEAADVFITVLDALSRIEDMPSSELYTRLNNALLKKSVKWQAVTLS